MMLFQVIKANKNYKYLLLLLLYFNYFILTFQFRLELDCLK